MPRFSPKVLDIIKAANESLTRAEFKASFEQVKRMLRIAVDQLDARVMHKISLIHEGYTPIKGKDYFDGQPGKPGYTPVKGKDYFDGEPGKPGYTPVKGKDYFDGKKGDKGDPGTPADIENAVRAILSQSMEEIDKRMPLVGDSIRAGIEIRIQEYLKKFGEYQYGGGQSAVTVMQSGVLKVRAAPKLNFTGSGAPTVTIDQAGVTHLNFPTGSGSGFQQKTSGVVDSSNTVFVFTTAPNVIVVDNGRAMQKVSSDGTVNWTGTTTVTLAIAPTIDIYATS